MCRFVAYLGEPIFLEDLIAKPRHSLMRQSLRAEDATPIGPGCARCHRPACMQRSLPPRGAALQFDDRALGLTPFGFAG